MISTTRRPRRRTLTTFAAAGAVALTLAACGSDPGDDTGGTDAAGGDDLGLIDDGTLVVAWDELIGGAHVAAARWLRVSVAGVPTFGAPVRLAAAGASSHPVLAGSSSGVVAAWSTGGESSHVMVRVVPMD